MRNKVVPAFATLLLAGTLAACGTPASSSSGSAAETVKVAIIPPSSGALAQFGSDAAKGWQYAVDEVNAKGGIDGRKVELIKKDTDATSATTLRAAREVVTQDGAAFIGGVMTSTENGALNQQLAGLNALSFNSLGKDDGLTGKDCTANAFRTVQTNSMDVNALAASLKTLPGQKWAIQAVDYSTGHSAAEVFKQAAEAAGKQVVLEQYAPLNTTEFGSYISKLNSSDADALFAVEYGADGVAFVNQAAQFNLPAKLKSVLGFNMVSEPLFPALGEKIVGFYNNVGYDVAANNALNTAFVQGFSQKYGSKPYYVEADAYLAAETLFAGIHKAGSADPAKVRDALNNLSFDSIAGQVTMRAGDHQLVRPSYLGQVVKDGSGLAFKIIASANGAQTTPQADPACKL
ncbi:ABC transporter substrate-binding protein [Amycolatopsis sp. K13G38]|uniref:ABC transporter substrate-binding protein n=1 Tax=Amycolatopsis acididurans TaxID=2724524 RepID=A0ABX1J0V6_9PSEU|nr:ABC transporter substrate-binding protein [Amycolatopsis acididurans]